MVGVGWALGLVDGGEQECLVERVGYGVRGLGQHRAGPNQDPGGQFDESYEQVRGARDQHRPSR